ncbi:transcriptional regulator [Skermanella aerolata]|jgi:DNA-binding HxlR family transcriptional regulator|uniref:Transcriptional regulator n=2 Tax=Skermanella aerolata TaxID=393310 RepID=A0A512E1F6_9PROT|nr:transcriptional regulator [Skermanella aerolata KACC 11604]GEO42542.1 transcriptional regulator [Skermanella aerolata]
MVMSELPFRCGMEAVVNLIGGKWKILILFHLRDGKLRFSVLRRLVGQVSEKMLSQQLKELVEDGLLRRIDHKTVPPHVEYELTAFGINFCRSLQAVCEWGAANMDKVTAIAEARTVRQNAKATLPRA